MNTTTQTATTQWNAPRRNGESASTMLKFQPAHELGAAPSRSTTSIPAQLPRRKRLGLVSAGFVSLLLVAITGCYWWQQARTWEKTDNAYTATHIHNVSARVAGTVQEVLVDENQMVAAGTVLARLDPRDFEIRRQQAQAQLAQAGAQVKQAEAQVGQARAQLAREQARATKAQRDLDRARALSQGSNGAISRQEFDQAQAEFDAAQAAVQAAQANVDAAGALGAAAQAQEQVARANLDEAQLQLSYTEIRAPVAGRIGKKNLETGNRVQPGQALLGLVRPEVWMVANFKETQLGRVRPGQEVRMRLDAFPGRVFAGRVDSVSPASGAQFALLPPDNATGNFTRIVQRVPVKIVFDTATLGDAAGRIAAGMSAIVSVRVR